ncbi:transporter substrate-binding domain-containing protein [Aureimonas populi]|uniref:Transporter substrate-binding domain-containing protein n=1 Tax=Aureimonas populi TaxID=1701758 RepID=A0ABW5CFX0_9HYPH|nr:transporter substrate-binding domain-containing protein [Aureimonas populi]
MATPNFIDQRQAGPRPVLPTASRIRFLTSLDYPPFNFLDARGRLTGFHVELAQLLCDELGLMEVCQIEARPFDELLPALEAGEGDAILAGLAITSDSRRRVAFTESFFRYPARFVTRADAPLGAALQAGLPAARIGVVSGAAHEAMLGAFFPRAERVGFANREEALEALKGGEIAAVFGDGVGLSFWLAGEAADDCCAFSGGPYFSDVFLGEGLAVAVRQDDIALARAFDYALARIVEERRFSELLLRYFPVSAF